jgi:2,4-dienoyl-CoA reductase-like NADH-dependent reductase (Old Yellow Enzyme family)/thioredoxin reductase
VEAVHNEGAKVCVQLYHGGVQTTLAKRGGKAPMGPSAVSTTIMGVVPLPDSVEMTPDDIEYTIQAFVSTAVRAKTAGFDAVDIDGGAGYLIGSFMSAFKNHRTDEWGGSFENRMRFPVEIVKRTRAALGPDYPILFDLPMDDGGVPNGITPEEGVKMGLVLEEAGVDGFRIHPSVVETYITLFPGMATPPAPFARHGKMLKSALTRAKVLEGKRINTPELAEKLLEDGACDVVLLSRPLLVDPYYPMKAMKGRSKEIRPCVACNTCNDCTALARPVRCALNPLVGYEKEYQIEKADTKKTVLIVGGGPAGTEAARVATLQGHKVILCEKSNSLGGAVIYAAMPPHRDEFGKLVEYYRTQMEVLGVDVRLGTAVDKKFVQDLNPDAVIIATGARPIMPNIPGADGKQVLLAEEVLSNPAMLDKEAIVIVGGGTVGAETAELLWEKGKKVTVLEMLGGIVQDMGVFNQVDFMGRILQTGISFVTGATVTEIKPDSVIYKTEAGEQNIAADAVVLAVGYKPENQLVQELSGIKAEVTVVGDALSPRKIMDAIHEGFHAARRLGYSYHGI